MVNLERAIAAYTEAATIRRQPGLERDLATTLNNLGLAYWTQSQVGKEPVANRERAINAYTEATTIFRQLGLNKTVAKINTENDVLSQKLMDTIQTVFRCCGCEGNSKQI